MLLLYFLLTPQLKMKWDSSSRHLYTCTYIISVVYFSLNIFYLTIK